MNALTTQFSTLENQMPSIVPNDDADLYISMPYKVRMEFEYIYEHLKFITSARSTRAACCEVAARIGLNTRQLYERVLAYLGSGKWTDLVNKARAGAAFWESQSQVGLAVSFQKFYQGLCENNQRVNMGGYRELMVIWKTHHTSDGQYVANIPGYTSWPKADRAGRHPKGWSYKNLSRFAPDNYDSASARTGAFAASKFRPPVLRTRVGLAICERVEFDDHEYNAKSHFPGQPSGMRPLGFNAAECLSAKLFPSFKPTLLDLKEDKKKKLTEVDMMWFVVNWLTTIGYRTDARGTTLVVELGTATIKKAFAERIYLATNRKVLTSLPGMFNRPAHKGQFAPRGKGNFKHKPLVESSFSLVDNFFAALPGQTGLDRLTCPEELHGREQYFKTLLKAAASLSDERAAKLILPVLTWKQFLEKALDLYDAINWNPEHNLEGWDKLGFHATEYRLPVADSFTPWQLMPPVESPSYGNVLTAVNACACQPAYASAQLTQARNLSRAEVFHAEHSKAVRSGEIVKVSPWRYCDLMGIENGHRVVVGEKNLFEIRANDLTHRSTPLRYLARINGRHFYTGEEYLGFVNPFDPRVMLLCKQNGSPIGLCEQWEAPCQNDEEAQLRSVGKQQQWIAERAEGLNARHADKAAGLEHMREHNAAVIEQESFAQMQENRDAEAAAKNKINLTTNSDAAVADQLSRTNETVPVDAEEQWD